jgi:hypothetical protein
MDPGGGWNLDVDEREDKEDTKDIQDVDSKNGESSLGVEVGEDIPCHGIMDVLGFGLHLPVTFQSKVTSKF